MNRFSFQAVCVSLILLSMPGCQRSGQHGPSMIMSFEQMQQSQLRQDREAILKMAGTFKVDFSFRETLPLQSDYELAKPYNTSAEELVIVVENRERFVSLQHLLVVRHDGETHVINHWRQDWVYQPERSFAYNGDGSYRFYDCNGARMLGYWTQKVYNVADSPRYATYGRWEHRAGYSTWISDSEFLRPKPLRDSRREDYNVLNGKHQITVTDAGWTHHQDNIKDLLGTKQATAKTVVAIEQGINQYLRVPDENFEKAHDYWKNTAPYWKQVRDVWAEILASRDTLELADRWRGDALFTHLNGLGDEYWGQADIADEARPRIRQIIDAFVVKEFE